MRAQWTIRDSIYEEVKRRAEAVGIAASRLVEEYLTQGLRRDTTGVTLTTAITESVPRIRENSSLPHGSKETLYQTPAAEMSLEDIFEPAPPPRKPLGEMTDDELEDATNDAVPLAR